MIDVLDNTQRRGFLMANIQKLLCKTNRRIIPSIRVNLYDYGFLEMIGGRREIPPDI